MQSWSYLATLDPSHAASIDWAYANLAATDGPFSGVSFSNADRSGVWFEGTAHMAAALLARRARGDVDEGRRRISQNLALAQTEAPNEDGNGIDAASKDGLRTGDGDKYYAALHIGAIVVVLHRSAERQPAAPLAAALPTRYGPIATPLGCRKPEFVKTNSGA